MKFVGKKISILLAGMIAAGSGYAQVNPYAKIKKVDMFESRNDSVDLATQFWSIFPESEEGSMSGGYDEYESFDSESIHYPKFDFSTKKDSTLIYLLSGDQQYFPPCEGHVTSRFGMRRTRYHYGIDVKVYTGDPIYSVFDGVVRIARRSPSYGYIVVVRHSNGLETYYAHLSKLKVAVDQTVKAGELIGLGGNTGSRSRGSHLHFEVRYLGAPINPEDIIDFNNGKKLINPDLYLCSQNFRYLTEVSKMKAAAYHSVKKGETLGSISSKYRTSVSSICRLNGIRSSSIIRPGQRLRIR